MHDKSNVGSNLNCTGETQISYHVDKEILSDGSEVFDAVVYKQKIHFTDEKQMNLFCELLDSMSKNKAFVGMDIDTEQC